MNMKKGFTLIEIMIVVLIIGLLVAVAVPKMMNAKAKALQSVTKTLVTDLNKIVQRSVVDNVEFNTTLTAGDTKTSSAALITWINTQAPKYYPTDTVANWVVHINKIKDEKKNVGNAREHIAVINWTGSNEELAFSYSGVNLEDTQAQTQGQ